MREVNELMQRWMDSTASVGKNWLWWKGNWGPGSSFSTCTEHRNHQVGLAFPGNKRGTTLLSWGENASQGWCAEPCVRCHTQPVSSTWILQSGNISTGSWLHALDCYCSYKTTFFLFFFSSHKYSAERGVPPSLKVVHIQLIIGPPREFQIGAWTWFDIPGTLSRGWGTTCSHSVWVTSSMHSGTPLKRKEPYANFQAYDPPLGFFCSV